MTMRTLMTCLLLMLTAPAVAMEHYINNLQDRHGEAIGAVQVTVYQTGTLTKATIFSDNGINQKANPFYSDSDGYYDFYASNGVYDFAFVRSGYTFALAHTRIALFDVNDGGGGGGSSSFSGILSGTNNAAAMIVGTGSSLSFTGAGTVNANQFNGLTTIATANGGTGLTSAPDDTLMIGNGSLWQAKALPAGCATSTSKLLYDSATNTLSCGTDLSGAATFDALGSGTNTTATMTVGTGGSLTFSGSGTVNASTFKGNATIAAADGGTGQTAVTDDGLLVANGSGFQLKILPGCNNPTTDKLLYDGTANTFSCGTDQSSGGGTTFNTIGSGTNTTATMTVGTGGTITLSGTGNVTATSFWPNVVTVNAGNSPYTGLTTNATLLCDTSAAARTINLPAATNKVILTIFNMGSNTCTINRAGADTINTGVTSGLTSFILRNAGSTFWLQPDGASIWYVGG
jgi:hypothetical protein